MCRNGGLPIDKSYLEEGLPPFLRESVSTMQATWDKMDKGIECPYWDCEYCELQSNINVAEVERLISSEQAWYLREKYLGIKKEEF